MAERPLLGLPIPPHLDLCPRPHLTGQNHRLVDHWHGGNRFWAVLGISPTSAIRGTGLWMFFRNRRPDLIADRAPTSLHLSCIPRDRGLRPQVQRATFCCLGLGQWRSLNCFDCPFIFHVDDLSLENQLQDGCQILSTLSSDLKYSLDKKVCILVF